MFATTSHGMYDPNQPHNPGTSVRGKVQSAG
jgi:hypothetical protein